MDYHIFRARVVPHIDVVDCSPCQVAVTPILGRIWRPSVVFATGTPAGVSGLGGTFWIASSSRHVGTPVEDVSFTGCPFGYCLVTWADRPPPQDGSESAPLRSDRFLLSGTAACHLSISVGNSPQPLHAALVPGVTARIHGLKAVVSRLFSI